MNRVLQFVSVAMLASSVACNSEVKKQYQTLAQADSLRSDSLMQIKNEMLNEVMSSTQFVNDLNDQIATLKVPPTVKLTSKLTRESAINDMKSERDAVTSRIRELVSRLDSSQARLASLRERAKGFADRDSLLETQVAEYEKTIGDLREHLDKQEAQYKAVVDSQNKQIAVLNLKIDTATAANATLSAQRSALTDTVGQLTTEKNTAYYVVGTRDDLIKQGIIVEEGRKSFLLFGDRPVVPARTLDPSKFTRIDRLQDRVIHLPDGEYSIVTRQDPSAATPGGTKDGKITGSLTIDQPEKFWGASKFLVLVKD